MNMKKTGKPLVFISHIHEDKDVAHSLQDWVSENLLASLDIFVAGDEDSIPLGMDWPKKISDALRNCAVALLVISPQSKERKWIHFEAGAAFVRGVPVIPICCKGMTETQLTQPLSFLRAIELPDSYSEHLLLSRLAGVCDLKVPSNPSRFRFVPFLPEVQEFTQVLKSKSEYANWKFHINWPMAEWPMAEGPTLIDAYSPEVDWSQLLNAFSVCSVTSHDVESIFRTLRRLVVNNSPPPRKLSGTILFRDASKTTLEVVQDYLGGDPYELVMDRRVTHDKDLAADPAEIFPDELLADPNNFKNYKKSQERIMQFASLVCKHAMCSTYQISISQAIRLTKYSEKCSLAVACTAANTNKELLSIVAEIPVLMSSENEHKNKYLVWYGQKHKPPTSEYESHWEYHCQALGADSQRTLIVHFHPIKLSEQFKRLQKIYNSSEVNSFNEVIPPRVWRSAEAIAEGLRIDLKVFDRYEEVGARDRGFGQFMAETAIQSLSKSTNFVVWKPNHGVWILMTEEATEKDLRDSIRGLEQFAAGLKEYSETIVL